MSFYDYLKNIFLILILLQIAPTLLTGIKRQYLKYLEPKTQVAIIPFKGAIYDASPYIKQLTKFFKDDDVKALLFKMECQGSAAGSGQTIYNEILALKKEHPKPVIVLIENLCASGGYWIASAGDYIIAPGSALVGSIGSAFQNTFKLKDFLENYHIYYESFKAGAYKGATDPFTATTPEERTMLQSVLDDSYQQFVQAVATERKLSVNNASEWADGKIFTAHQGIKLGLVDELGSVSTAIRILKEKALIDGEIEWIHPELPGGWFAKFFGAQQNNETSLFSTTLESICSFFETRYATTKVG